MKICIPVKKEERSQGTRSNAVSLELGSSTEARENEEKKIKVED